ncbi:MAG: nuclear transport factor 2 family protein [Actinomycetota bacterium]
MPSDPDAATHDPRLDVAQTVYEFASGIDGRDWTRYREIFVPPPATIRFDYESYHGRPATDVDVDGWVGGVRQLFDHLDATQHTMSNPIVEIEHHAPSGRSTARCRVYMQAAHFLWRDDLAERTGSSDPEFTIGGFYDDELIGDREGPYGWRIRSVRLTVWWRRGNEAIMSLARSGAGG